MIIPIVQEFKQSQGDVNDLLQLVANTISNNVTNQIIESTEGDVLRGETGSRVQNTKPGVVHKTLKNCSFYIGGNS